MVLWWVWWRTPRATFHPQRWLYEVIQQLTVTSWGPPIAWAAPLADGARLELRIWQETGALPRSAEDMAVFDPPSCCSAVADLRWTDGQGQRQQAVPVASVQGLERIFALSEVLQAFSESQRADIQQRLKAVLPAPSAVLPGLVAPCAPKSAAHAGVLTSPTALVHCCEWPVETGVSYATAQTLYVSATGTGTGLSDAAPMSFSAVRALLREVDGLLPGLTVLFKREEVYDASLLAGEKLDTSILLPIRASGVEGYPIRIGAWPDDASLARPKLYGDGDGEVGVDAILQEATLTGILIEGAQWVQIAELEVTNFKQGISVVSYPTVDGVPSLTGGTKSYAPLRGPRDIQLLNLDVHQNWNKGINISSNLNGLLSPLGLGGYFEDSGQIIIGQDYLGLRPYGGLEGDIVEVDIDPEGWWPERICVESCRIQANGFGEKSGSVNLSLHYLTSKCTVRHNMIAGGRHSEGWYNLCGRVASGEDSRGYEYDPAFWEPADDALRLARWETWGMDGLTMHVGGCGNLIENNVFKGHIHGQSSGAGKCGGDDGNGVDLKATGNRTYWETRYDGPSTDGRPSALVLADLPNVIRNNVFTENANTALLIQFGCRNLHVYNNEFSYNNGPDGSAIRVKAGALKGGMWRSDYLRLGDTVLVNASYPPETGQIAPPTVEALVYSGPGLMKDIFIYRNILFKNGYNSDGTPGGGANAVKIHEEGDEGWHGSFENLWLAHNTIANNYGYGLVVTLEDLSAEIAGVDGAYHEVTNKDAGEYHMGDLHLLNNIIVFNDGPLFENRLSGWQVLFWDQLDIVGSLRGFLCSMESAGYCCYYDATTSEIIRVQYVEKSTGQSFTYSLLDLQGTVHVPACRLTGLMRTSISSDPDFVDVFNNDYRITSTSPCLNAGLEVVSEHYETTTWISLGPDYDYEFRLDASNVISRRPDIGADELIY